MKSVFLILFFPTSIYAQIDTTKIKVHNEVHYLFKKFIPTSYINISSDSIRFKVIMDSSLIVDQVWTHDTSKVWVHYADHGNSDFWEEYAQMKYPDNKSIHQQLETNPTKFIKEYFDDKEIPLHSVFIYYAANSLQAYFKLCGGCYMGTDFLFKIDKPDFAYLKGVSWSEMEVVKSNYR